MAAAFATATTGLAASGSATRPQHHFRTVGQLVEIVRCDDRAGVNSFHRGDVAIGRSRRNGLQTVTEAILTGCWSGRPAAVLVCCDVAACSRCPAPLRHGVCLVSGLILLDQIDEGALGIALNHRIGQERGVLQAS